MFNISINFNEDEFAQQAIDHIKTEVDKRLKHLKCDKHDEKLTTVSLISKSGDLAIKIDGCCKTFEKTIYKTLDNLEI